jgi:hypothetical protein
MGSKGSPLDRSTITRLAAAMVVGGTATPSSIPAGYTYLGQFIAHDLTFDRTANVALGETVSPADLEQGRSPTLDLDSLYGAGPDDPESRRRFYEDEAHLRMGDTVTDGGLPAKAGFDLPRGPDTRVAAIPDERNDDNLAVAQTHLAFIRFHNRVVDCLSDSIPPALRFAQARELVVKHYQWMIRTDYLPRICAGTVVEDVFCRGRQVFEVDAPPTAMPTMPVEFSIGAFRLGHSMVRRSYNWNSRHEANTMTLRRLFTFSGKGGDLGGRDRLPVTAVADFRRLYEFGRRELTEEQFNRAMRIDTMLTTPLQHLPSGTFGDPEVGPEDLAANLAFRNLTRASMVELATGQQMAEDFRCRGVPVTPLAPEQILKGEDGARLDDLPHEQRDAIVEHTPLWFYVLREAELAWGRLGPVGARIVAETFHRAMQGSSASIVRDRAWRPSLGPNCETFGMVDLLMYASDGERDVLAPIG